MLTSKSKPKKQNKPLRSTLKKLKKQLKEKNKVKLYIGNTKKIRKLTRIGSIKKIERLYRTRKYLKNKKRLRYRLKIRKKLIKRLKRLKKSQQSIKLKVKRLSITKLRINRLKNIKRRKNKKLTKTEIRIIRKTLRKIKLKKMTKNKIKYKLNIEKTRIFYRKIKHLRIRSIRNKIKYKYKTIRQKKTLGRNVANTIKYANLIYKLLCLHTKKDNKANIEQFGKSIVTIMALIKPSKKLDKFFYKFAKKYINALKLIKGKAEFNKRRDEVQKWEKYMKKKQKETTGIKRKIQKRKMFFVVKSIKQKKFKNIIKNIFVLKFLIRMKNVYHKNVTRRNMLFITTLLITGISSLITLLPKNRVITRKLILNLYYLYLRFYKVRITFYKFFRIIFRDRFLVLKNLSFFISGSINKMVSSFRTAVNLNTVLIRFYALHNRNVNAHFVLNYILLKLAQYFFIDDILRPLTWHLKTLTVLIGYRIIVAGRLTRKERAAYMLLQWGLLPPSTINLKIDYALGTLPMRFGMVSVRVYLLCKKQKPYYYFMEFKNKTF